MEPFVKPFTILIDSNESHPFSFRALTCDANRQNRPLVVRTKWKSLGRYPNGLGDYAIEGLLEDHCRIERKSVEDLQGTLLGWPKLDEEGNQIRGSGRRERFGQELENLQKIQSAAVVVEGSMSGVFEELKDYGKKTVQTQAKILFRSIIAMQQDYAVQWLMCDGRRAAEVTAFRFLERFWRHNHE